VVWILTRRHDIESIHSPTYAVVTFRKFRRESENAYLGTEYTCSQLCMYDVYTREWSWNANSNTPEPDRPQHDRPATCVIAQQYSSTTFVSLRFYSRKKKIRPRFQKCFIPISFSLALKLRAWNCITWRCVSRGASALTIKVMLGWVRINYVLRKIHVSRMWDL
jgi:hypothetical protein